MQQSKAEPQPEQTMHPQILLNGVWHDARATFERVGGKGYDTYWTVLDERGRMPAWDGTSSSYGVGYNDHAFRRMLADGRARFLNADAYDAWADEESVRRLQPAPAADREAVRSRADRARSPLRRVPPAGTTREALRRLFHVRGSQWERHTGETWGKDGEDGKRRELIRELYESANPEREVAGATLHDELPSSSDLGLDELSVLVDWLTADLVEAGFDLEAAERAYAERCRARDAQREAHASAESTARSREAL